MRADSHRESPMFEEPTRRESRIPRFLKEFLKGFLKGFLKETIPQRVDSSKNRRLLAGRCGPDRNHYSRRRPCPWRGAARGAGGPGARGTGCLGAAQAAEKARALISCVRAP